MKAPAGTVVHSLCGEGVQDAGKRYFKGSPLLIGSANSRDFTCIMAVGANAAAPGEMSVSECWHLLTL